MSYEDQDYHRRRAEIELEHAVSAEAPESAAAHLELARMHRARRQVIVGKQSGSTAGGAAVRVFRTDKEA